MYTPFYGWSTHHHNCVSSVDDSVTLGKNATLPPLDLILGFKKCPGQRNPGSPGHGTNKGKKLSWQKF